MWPLLYPIATVHGCLGPQQVLIASLIYRLLFSTKLPSFLSMLLFRLCPFLCSFFGCSSNHCCRSITGTKSDHILAAFPCSISVPSSHIPVSCSLGFISLTCKGGGVLSLSLSLINPISFGMQAELGISNLKPVKLDINQISLQNLGEEKPFDRVVSIECLEHSKNYEAAPLCPWHPQCSHPVCHPL